KSDSRKSKPAFTFIYYNNIQCGFKANVLMKALKNPKKRQHKRGYINQLYPLLLSLYVDKLFNCISKSFTSFKRWNFASRNLYFLTSLRITSFSSRTFTYFKVTKADNLYFFTAF